MAPKRCSRCNVNKDDVELRQSDELLCQVCTNESLRKGKSRGDPKEDLKIMYVLYESLVDKLKVKKKTVNDKPKIRFRWLGSLDFLKEFVTLVLKKSGSWSESRKSSISFKTANLTIAFYKNTLTFQLQGNKATEIANLLISLKEIEASTNPIKAGSTSPARQFYQMTKPSLMHYLFLRDLPVPVIIPHLTLLLDQTLLSGLN